MNLKIVMSDFTTSVTINEISSVKEQGSFLNFFTDGTTEPIASFRVAEIAYWTKL